MPRVLLLALLALPLPALAEVKPQTKEVGANELVKLGFFQDFDELNLEELLGAGEVKTSLASGLEQTLEEAPGSVSVITAEEVRNQGFRTLEDLLRTLPGFDVLTDGLGRNRIVLRGVTLGAPDSGSDAVLILFNGQPLTEPLTGGATALNLDFPLENVSRVEVLRGPGSALYGPGPCAGVVNVVTAGVGDFEGIGLLAGLGSFDTRRLGLRLGAAVGEVSVAGFVHFADTAGAQLSIPTDAQPASISNAPGRMDDRRRSIETSYRVGWRDLTLNFRLKSENSGGMVGSGGTLGTQNDLSDRQLGAGLEYQRRLGGDGTLRASLSFDQSQISQLLEVYPPGFQRPTPEGGVERFSSGIFLQAAVNQRSLGATLRLDRRLGDHHLLGGAGLGHSGTYGLEASGNLDFRTLKAQTGLQPLADLFADASRTSANLYLEDAWTASSRISVTGGVRLDHGSDYGTQLSPRAALVATLPREMTLKLLYGRAFRPPSFAELAFHLPGLSDNPDLKPATTDTAEAALVYKGKDLRVVGSVFLTWLRDPIGPEGSFTPLDPRRLVNLPGVDLRGFELEARRSFGMSDSIFLSYTHQEAEDAETGARRADIPRDMATLGATFTFKDQYTITPTLLLRGSRARAAGDPRPALDGYGIFNLTLRAQGLVRSLDVWATAGNLFDTEYLDPSPMGGVPGDYPRPGRSLFLGASYKF